MKNLAGAVGQVTLDLMPPTIRVKVTVFEVTMGWEATQAVEHALRDAAWALYGKKTGPGYPIRLEPSTAASSNGAGGFMVEARVTVVPKGETDRARLQRYLEKAVDRARFALRKLDVTVVEPDALSQQR